MKNKEGRRNHIATDHRPMVQGGLLTVHPGSIHGCGEAPRGGSSLRQGAEKRSSGAPDLGSAAAAEQRRDREKGFPSRGFCVTGKLQNENPISQTLLCSTAAALPRLGAPEDLFPAPCGGRIDLRENHEIGRAHV